MKSQSTSAIIRGSSADISNYSQDLLNTIGHHHHQQRKPKQKRVLSSVRQQSQPLDRVNKDQKFKNKISQINKSPQQLQSLSQKQELRQFIESHLDDLSCMRNTMAKIITSKERFSMVKEEERSAITRQANLIAQISSLEQQLSHPSSSLCQDIQTQAKFIRVSSDLSIKSRQLSNIRAVETYLIDQFENSRGNLEEAFDQISKLTEDPDTGILSQIILDAVGFCGTQVYSQLTKLFKYTQMNEKITFSQQIYVYYTSTYDLQVLSVISKLQLLVIEQMQCNFNRLEKKYFVQSYLQSILLAYDYSNRSLADAFRERQVFAKHKMEYDEVEEEFIKKVQKIQQEMNVILETINPQEYPKLTMFLNQYATFQPILEMFFKDFLKMDRSQQERLQNLVIADLKAKHVNFMKIVNIIESNESTFKQLTNILTTISVTMLKTHCFSNETELLVQEIEVIKESQRQLLLELENNQGIQLEANGLQNQNIINRIKELELIRQRNQQYIDEELKGNIIALQLELRNGQDKLNQMFKETTFSRIENNNQGIHQMINSQIEYAYELLNNRQEQQLEEVNQKKSIQEQCVVDYEKQLIIGQDEIQGFTVVFENKSEQKQYLDQSSIHDNSQAACMVGSEGANPINNIYENQTNEDNIQYIDQLSLNTNNKNINNTNNSPILIIDSPDSRKIKSNKLIGDQTSNSSNYLEGSTLPSDYLSHDRTHLHNGNTNNNNNILQSYNCQPFLIQNQQSQIININEQQVQQDKQKVDSSLEFELTFSGYEKAKRIRSFFKKQRYSEENPLCTKQELEQLYSIDLENARRKADELLLKNQLSYDSDQYYLFASSLDKLTEEDKENRSGNINQQYHKNINVQHVGKINQRQVVQASFEKRKSSISQQELIKQQKKCFAYCQKTNKTQQISNKSREQQQQSEQLLNREKIQKRKEFKVMIKTKSEQEFKENVMLAFREDAITLEGFNYYETFQAKNIQQVVVPLTTLKKLEQQKGVKDNNYKEEKEGTRILQDISNKINEKGLNQKNNELYYLEVTVMNKGICQIAIGSQRHFLAILTRFKLLFQ